MPETPGNDTPNTPSVSETELREMTVVDLRDRAAKAGVESTSDMRKDELVAAVAKPEGSTANSRPSSSGAGPDGGRVRTGSGTSDSLKLPRTPNSLIRLLTSGPWAALIAPATSRLSTGSSGAGYM